MGGRKLPQGTLMHDDTPKGQAGSRPIVSIQSEWTDTSLMMRLVELESSLRHKLDINIELFIDRQSSHRILIDDISYIDISPLTYNYRFHHYHRIIGYYTGIETRLFNIISDYAVQYVERMTCDAKQPIAHCEHDLDSLSLGQSINWLGPLFWFVLISLASFIFLIGIPL